MSVAVRQRLHWLALHGSVRGAAVIGARRNDPLAQLFTDSAVRADPVGFYDVVRARGRMVPSRVGYLTADHAIAHELLRSDDFGAVEIGSDLPAPLRWLERRTRNDLLQPLRPPSLLAVEPPAHIRYRKPVSSLFTSKTLTTLRKRVERTAETLLEQLTADTAAVDVASRYCTQLPIAIIGDVLGVPDRDRAQVLKFGELASHSLDFGLTWPRYQRMQRGLEWFGDWLADHVDRLRRCPRDDLVSELIQTYGSGASDQHLDDQEIQAIAGLMLVAGFETTANLLSNGIHMLLAAPEHRQMLQKRPDLWSNTVDEILRLDSPVQLTRRMACTDTEVAGTVIRSGEVIVVGLAAANRDPKVFADPHHFDIERANANRHLAFSTGRHYCVGAALARLEGEVGLRAFFDRFPDAQAAGVGNRRDTLVLRGWSSLPVTLSPAQPAAEPCPGQTRATAT
ncbi:cytochrome P450 [Mycobacterium syngnathidarum]